jgi:hypothetical protein
VFSQQIFATFAKSKDWIKKHCHLSIELCWEMHTQIDKHTTCTHIVRTENACKLSDARNSSVNDAWQNKISKCNIYNEILETFYALNTASKAFWKLGVVLALKCKPKTSDIYQS